MTAPNKRPQITSRDADMHDPVERDLSLDEDHPEIQPAPASAIYDERTRALLDEEKRLRAFMEEPVTFQITETDDANAVNPVPCGVNGVSKYFKRGEVYTAPRKFVESLLKVTWRVKTINYKDKDGVDQTKIEQTPSLVYPVSILNDPSGMDPNDKGRRWFLHQQRNG